MGNKESKKSNRHLPFVKIELDLGSKDYCTKTVLALVDSGSTISIVKDTILKKFKSWPKAKREKIDLSLTLAAKSHKRLITERVQLNIKFEGTNGTQSMTHKFLLLPDLSYDALIGSDMLLGRGVYGFDKTSLILIKENKTVPNMAQLTKTYQNLIFCLLQSAYKCSSI